MHERDAITIEQYQRSTDVVNVASKSSIVVFDALSINVNGQCDLHLFPCQLAFCANHPAEQFLGFFPLWR